MSKQKRWRRERLAMRARQGRTPASPREPAEQHVYLVGAGECIHWHWCSAVNGRWLVVPDAVREVSAVEDVAGRGCPLCQEIDRA